ncbi:MAG: isochorismate synthase [Actinobacteria bacterium]|nr:isochorismate synthase [Actinomycetota bacterium]
MTVRFVTRRAGRGELPPSLPSTRFLSPRRDLRGWGEALRIELPAPWVDHVAAVTTTLQGIEHDDALGARAGSGPVAFGALPFDRSASATFIVPAWICGSTADGASWVSHLDGLHEAPPTPSLDGPRTLTLSTPTTPEEWKATVAEATDHIRAGELEKVVLSRALDVVADRPFDAHAIAARLAAAHPHSFRYDVDGYVGATPELLVSRFDDVVRAHPMAGTTPRTGDVEIDSAQASELLHSPKNRGEHQITIDMVLDTLLGYTSFVDAAPAPSVVAAGSVQHLATLVEGRLSEPPASVLELVAALHPTPAVGGNPRDAALALLAELEGEGRGPYAGPVGWVDAHGNGAWGVALRGAVIDGNRARLRAGVGIVADSDPESEFAETQAKFAAVLGAVTRL